MALPDCCAAAKERLADGGIDAAKAHVKALREHSDGKHEGYQPAAIAAVSLSASKK